MISSEYIASESQGNVTVLTFARPPHNFFNADVIKELLAHLKEQDANENCRATVLAAEGKVFCAGGEFGFGDKGAEAYIAMARDLYAEAMQLFRIKKPIVAAVHGAAIGAGLGLALVADFRVTCKQARFSANFNRLGLHSGFGMSITLPRLIGTNRAELMLYTGRRFDGQEAVQMGLANSLVDQADVRAATLELAQDIACSGPVAVQDTRATFREGLADEIQAANLKELEIQIRHMHGDEFRKGVRAVAERRLPKF